jgi:uncharacterized repeat protein (TIGR01451 family)
MYLGGHPSPLYTWHLTTHEYDLTRIAIQSDNSQPHYDAPNIPRQFRLPPNSKTVVLCFDGVPIPGLTLTKTSTNYVDTDDNGILNTPITVPDTVNYRLVATNTGTVTLTDVTIADPNVTGLACDQTLLATLAPAATLTCDGIHTVDQSDLDTRTRITNTATATGGGQTVTAIDHYIILIEQDPSIDVTKTPVEQHRTIGEVTDITWTITVENSGNITLTDIEIRDVLIVSLDEPRTPLDKCARSIPSLNPGSKRSYDCAITDREITVEEFANLAIVEAVAVGDRILIAAGAAVVRSDTSVAAMGSVAFSDLNRNGIHDPGEAGIAGIQVILTDSHGSAPVSMNTDSAGEYLFSDLPIGTYTVTLQPGSFSGELTTAGAYTTTLGANKQSVGNDFGIADALPASYRDLDRLVFNALSLLALGSIPLGVARLLTGGSGAA